MLLIKLRLPPAVAAVLAICISIVLTLYLSGRARFPLAYNPEAHGLGHERCHPATKELLADPFFWDILDDYSPHGNDDGADTFATFLGWREQNPDISSRIFIYQLLSNWDAYDLSIFGRRTIEDVTIATAFAHLKLEGNCPRWLKKKALGILLEEKQLMEKEPIKYKDGIICYHKMIIALAVAPTVDTN